MSALVEFINYIEGTDKSSELFLLSKCPRGKALEGDWLTGPIDIADAKHLLITAVEDMEKHSKYKYANPCQVVDEGSEVYILSKGISTQKERRICGYRKLDKTHA